MEQNPSNGRTSNVRTYLLYATGEVLLVVIGILIALQLNEWRDNYLTRQQEIKTVIQLVEDLDTERVFMEDFIGKLDTQRVATVGFLKALKQGESEDSVSKYRYHALNVYNYSPASPTYDGLKQNGTLDLISDDSLRNNIIYHFDYLVTYFEDLRKSYHLAVNNAEQALLPYMGMKPGSNGLFRVYAYSDLDALQTNSEMHHLLGEAGRMRQFLSWRLRNLFIPKNEILRSELESYLYKLTR